jgi:hypothetical protein
MRETFPERPFRVFEIDMTAADDDRRSGGERRSLERVMNG